MYDIGSCKAHATIAYQDLHVILSYFFSDSVVCLQFCAPVWTAAILGALAVLPRLGWTLQSMQSLWIRHIEPHVRRIASVYHIPRHSGGSQAIRDWASVRKSFLFPLC